MGINYSYLQPLCAHKRSCYNSEDWIHETEQGTLSLLFIPKFRFDELLIIPHERKWRISHACLALGSVLAVLAWVGGVAAFRKSGLVQFCCPSQEIADSKLVYKMYCPAA
jgi:hypothetical protein